MEGGCTDYFRVNPINLAEEPVVVDVLKNPKVMGRTSLFSVPGSIIIKTTLVKSVTEALWCTQTMFLSKQVWTVWQMDRCSDAQISWRLYTSGKAYSNLVLQATLPGTKRPVGAEDMLPLQEWI